MPALYAGILWRYVEPVKRSFLVKFKLLRSQVCKYNRLLTPPCLKPNLLFLCHYWLRLGSLRTRGVHEGQSRASIARNRGVGPPNLLRPMPQIWSEHVTGDRFEPRLRSVVLANCFAGLKVGTK